MLKSFLKLLSWNVKRDKYGWLLLWVCSWLAREFWYSTLKVRIGFSIFSMFFWSGVLLYFILYFIMKKE